MSSVVNAAATIFIGAKLGSGFGSVFKSAEKSALKLGQIYRDTNKQLATANNVIKYGKLLKELRAKQEAMGGSSKSLADGIANVEKLYAAAKTSARGYGLEVGNIAREQEKLSLKSKLAKMGASNVGAAARIVGGGVAAGTALFMSAKDMSEQTQALQNQARALGFTTQKLQEYRAIAGSKGIQEDAFGDAMMSQAEKISKASLGIGEGAQRTNKLIRELGLDTQFLQNLSPDKQFNLIADGLNKIGNQNDKIRIANELWEGNGEAMLNMAAMGSKGLGEMAKQVDTTGNVLNENAKKNLSIFNTQLFEMKEGLTGIQTRIIVGAVPALIGLMNVVGPTVSMIGKGIDAIGGFNTILSIAAGVALPALIGAIPALILGIQTLGWAVAANPIGLMFKVLAVGAVLLITHWDTVKNSVVGALDWIGKKAIWLFTHTPMGYLFKGAALLGHAAADYISGSSSDASSAMKVPIATAAAANGGGGGTTIGSITVHASPGMDEEKLAHHVVKQIDERDRRAAAKRRGAHHD